jgi:23S rRNA pseudouridine2457 synthase
MSAHRYFLVNKPYDMVSQFVSSHEVRLLGDLDFNFPEGTHAIGRLDQNSEGLLLLTTNKKITKLLFQGPIPHKRTYLVQVKNAMKVETANKLAAGIEISAKTGTSFTTTPCEVQIVHKPLGLFEVGQPLHENVITTWINITLTEGKFHQVRKMVAAVNHKCIRLIRVAIEDIQLGNMQPGEVLEISEEQFFKNLHLNEF